MYIPTVTTPVPEVPIVNPNVCPGCGRCRTCGQPQPVIVPMPPVPIWPTTGDPMPALPYISC
jgi:hypothetical protein